jgi:NhaP-type Na+/H+ or K+/H+ antiporter
LRRDAEATEERLVEQLEVVFGSFVLLVVIATLARRIEVPYPILLVLGGLAIGLLPGLPRVEPDPELVLLVFLPPLLYAAAIATPVRELRANLQPISLLAFGLVLATIAVVADTAHLVIPGVSWSVGFTLGAIVSPPDPVAATAIANRLGLPRRLVTILEAEGLFNDATALVAYRLAVAAVVTGSFSAVRVGTGFLLAAVGGVVIGLVVGWAGRMVLGRLFDPPVENTVQLLFRSPPTSRPRRSVPPGSWRC